MSDLYWPGDERAGALMSGESLLAAVVAVESAWLQSLVAAGIAPPDTRTDLAGLVGPADVARVAAGAEDGGNPVIPALTLLRERLRDGAAATSPDARSATWIHRGLTSQDVLDTALMLCLRDVLERLRDDVAEQVQALTRLAGDHGGTLMVARTLTQHAVPTTFALKVAQWLTAVLDAGTRVDAVLGALPGQIGGAAGTLAAVAELAAGAGLEDPARQARAMARATLHRLGLGERPPWHTARAPVTEVGDALVGCTDAWGRIARDVTTLSRPEIAELRESPGSGRGGSSTMPQKRNPVLAVLIRRAALTAPGLAAVLHACAADAVDERPDGAWHAEWATIRTLARQAVTAGSQARELLATLEVDGERMLATLTAAGPDVLAERTALAALSGLSGRAPDGGPATYLGAAALIVDDVLDRARAYRQEHP